MIGPLGRMAIRIAHEIVTEWRSLEAPPPQPRRQEMSCTSATIERGDGWDHDTRSPAVAARIGFGKRA